MINFQCQRRRRRTRQLNIPPGEIPPELSLRGKPALGDKPMTEAESTYIEAAIADRDRRYDAEDRELRAEGYDW